MEPVRVVCLIGSSRFKDLFHKVGERLEKSGTLVLMMSFFQHADSRPVSPEEREVLRRVDRRRLELCDEVLVVDGSRLRCSKCGKWAPDHMNYHCVYCRHPDCWNALHPLPYVGEDTEHEINVAQELGKPVTYLNDRPELLD